MAKPEQCAHCKKPATIHLTQIINNKIYKVDLCEDCPFKKGVTDPEGFSLADFLLKPGELLGAGHATLKCPQCGFTPADFKKYGRFGCASCYDAFSDMLKPMLANMHKDTAHSGKVPERAIARVGFKSRLGDLEHALAEAVASENYEEAARIRDEIQALRESAQAEPDSV